MGIPAFRNGLDGELAKETGGGKTRGVAVPLAKWRKSRNEGQGFRYCCVT